MRNETITSKNAREIFANNFGEQNPEKFEKKFFINCVFDLQKHFYAKHKSDWVFDECIFIDCTFLHMKTKSIRMKNCKIYNSVFGPMFTLEDLEFHNCEILCCVFHVSPKIENILKEFKCFFHKCLLSPDTIAMPANAQFLRIDGKKFDPLDRLFDFEELLINVECILIDYKSKEYQYCNEYKGFIPEYYEISIDKLMGMDVRNGQLKKSEYIKLLKKYFEIQRVYEYTIKKDILRIKYKSVEECNFDFEVKFFSFFHEN